MNLHLINDPKGIKDCIVFQGNHILAWDLPGSALDSGIYAVIQKYDDGAMLVRAIGEIQETTWLDNAPEGSAAAFVDDHEEEVDDTGRIAENGSVAQLGYRGSRMDTIIMDEISYGSAHCFWGSDCNLSKIFPQITASPQSAPDPAPVPVLGRNFRGWYTLPVGAHAVCRSCGGLLDHSAEYELTNSHSGLHLHCKPAEKPSEDQQSNSYFADIARRKKALKPDSLV